MEKYNGWTNYATWRVNLEIFDGFNPYEELGRPSRESAYEMGLCLKDYAEEIIMTYCIDSAPNFAFDYAMAFLSDVNWTEIARHMIENYSEAA